MPPVKLLAGWLPLLAAPLLFLALHARTLDYGLVWMDEPEIAEGEIVVALGSVGAVADAFRRPLHSRRVQGLDQLRNPYYRPLQVVLVSAIHRATGAAPRIYRVASLGLGALCLAAFTALALRLLERPLLATFAACVVAVHPVVIEACVWISGLAEGLAALFVIASVLAGLLCVGAERRPRIGWGVVSVLALLVALCSKEKAVVAPALLLAGIVSAASTPVGTGSTARAALEGFGGLRAGAALVLTQGALVLLYLFLWRPLALGSAVALAPAIGGSPATHLASAVAAWPAALAWLFLPLSSSASDAVRVVTSALDPMLWLGLALAASSAVAWLLLLRAGRPVAAFGLAWLWIAFLPTANLLPQIHARGERYLFLSAFGAGLLVADLLPALLRAGASRARAILCAGLALLWLGFLAERSWARAPAWRSSRALFEGDVARDPAFREGRHHLASDLFAEGRYAAAERQVRALLEEDPELSDRWSYVNRIGVEELACQIQLARQRPRRVLAQRRRLEAEQREVAELPSLRTCFASALDALDQDEAALELLLAVAEELPEEPPPRLSLMIANSYAKLRRPEEARAWLARAEASGIREPALDFELRRIRRSLGRAR